jgi:hypothetical protein
MYTCTVDLHVILLANTMHNLVLNIENVGVDWG